MPDYIRNASQSLVSQSQELRDRANNTTMPTLQIADMTADQQAAFQKIRDLANQAPMKTERVVDENGKLGAIDDYFNKYAAARINPAMRAIDESTAQRIKQVGAGATSAGAFGDARHGIVENGVYQAAVNAKKDLVDTASADAFDKAMAARQVDLSRFTDVDKTNFSNTITSIQALLGSGGIQQGHEQAKHQAVFDQYMAEYGKDFDVLAAMASALGVAQSGADRTQTTTSTTPDNSILQGLGSLGGAALGTEAGATAALGLLAMV
jgi:hypothetical protein